MPISKRSYPILQLKISIPLLFYQLSFHCIDSLVQGYNSLSTLSANGASFGTEQSLDTGYANQYGLLSRDGKGFLRL